MQLENPLKQQVRLQSEPEAVQSLVVQCEVVHHHARTHQSLSTLVDVKRE